MDLELLDRLEDRVDVAVSTVRDLRVENEILKEETQDLEKKVKPWMFLAPDSVKNPAGSVFKYASAFHKLHTVGTTYAKLRHQRGWSIVDSLGLPLLQEAVSMLPVLGGFYSGAIGIFVNLDAELFWKKHHDRIRDRIAREGGGRF